MTRPLARAALLAVALALAGCAPDYSPNTYASTAVQQAAKVDKGVIVGVRAVDVTTSGVVGAATGAAAGGVLGAQAPGSGVTSALGAIGGGLVGGLVGAGVERTVTDTTAYEYIVQKTSKELVSVTQKDATPLAIGVHVLVIAGPQARIVPDYTVEPPPVATLAPPSPRPASSSPDAAGAMPPRAADAALPAGGGMPQDGTEPPPTPVSATPLPPPIALAPAPSAVGGAAVPIPAGANQATAPPAAPASP